MVIHVRVKYLCQLLISVPVAHVVSLTQQIIIVKITEEQFIILVSYHTCYTYTLVFKINVSNSLQSKANMCCCLSAGSL